LDGNSGLFVEFIRKTAGGGNPAGVVLNEDTLSGADMQRIAGLIGFSETVFL
jgi:predicted PhzF superfamily epimerase YddE/YHI9